MAKQELSVGEIASSYDISLAAVSKHLIVLENARLVTKRREGKLQVVALARRPDRRRRRLSNGTGKSGSAGWMRLEKYLEKQR